VVAHDLDRRRIERELHDGPQQHLVALSVELQLARDQVDADPLAARARLEDMGRQVELALEETRTLAHRIYPPLLETGGLRAALRAASVAAGVRARIEVEAGADVPPEIAGAVYFSCVEALERAGRDAPTAVRVGVEDRAVVFEVTGGGVQSLESEGVLHVRDRVEALGGRLIVSSEPGEESRLRGWLPLFR
jgi:signal transduction histidine kinase